MSRVVVAAGLLCILGWAALALGFAPDPERSGVAYLFAFCCAFTVAVGALLLLLIGHATNATWFVVVRRPCEVVASTLTLMVVLFLPIALLRGAIYPWYHPGELDETARLVLAKKTAWLNDRAFLARSAVYLVVFAVVAESLFYASRAQDRASSDRALGLRRRMVRSSGPLLLLSGLVLTFASFDWIMSLDPAFVANIYGVYVAAGGFTCAVALLCILSVAASSRSGLPDQSYAAHYHALGRVALASVAFWTYIGFAKLLLIWIADQPLEVRYYAVRWAGGWQYVGLMLLGVHFIIPFFALLSRRLKRTPPALVAVCALLVFAHLVDIYYQVLPFVRLQPSLHWVDIAALAAVLGAQCMFAVARARKLEAYPLRDPAVRAGLEYEAAS